jgi:hypothetical protein
MLVLAFRLATPSLLVDLRRLPGLGNIAVGDDESVRSRIQRTRALRRINTAALFTAVPKVRIRFPPAEESANHGFLSGGNHPYVVGSSNYRAVRQAAACRYLCRDVGRQPRTPRALPAGAAAGVR